MANPGGNYPGREIFLGSLVTGEPAFAYFGSGRSSGSQARYATPFIERESAVRIAPTDSKEKFDPFRHYQAIRIQPETGLVVVSNSQAPVDAAYEAYWLGPRVERQPRAFVQNILALLGPEYDNKEKPTSRILGVMYRMDNNWFGTVGITDEVDQSEELTFKIHPGHFRYLPTYNGDVDYRNFSRFNLGRTTEMTAQTAQDLADEIYGMSDYVDPKYGELRVWCVAGVNNGKGPGGWEIARTNRYPVE
jgi:IMP cyclohydrolase